MSNTPEPAASAISPHPASTSQDFGRAELAFWRGPAGRRISGLLSLCEALPVDAHRDELRVEISERHKRGEPIDSPDMQALIAKVDYAACAALSRQKRGWSARWLFDLCERYLRNMDWFEMALSHGPNRWIILEGRGTGIDRNDDFTAFWDIARTVAGPQPIPDYPSQDKRLSLAAVRNEVRRLMNWAAGQIPPAPPPAVPPRAAYPPVPPARSHLSAVRRLVNVTDATAAALHRFNERAMCIHNADDADQWRQRVWEVELTEWARFLDLLFSDIPQAERSTQTHILRFERLREDAHAALIAAGRRRDTIAADAAVSWLARVHTWHPFWPLPLPSNIRHPLFGIGPDSHSNVPTEGSFEYQQQRFTEQQRLVREYPAVRQQLLWQWSDAGVTVPQRLRDRERWFTVCHLRAQVPFVTNDELGVWLSDAAEASPATDECATGMTLSPVEGRPLCSASSEPGQPPLRISTVAPAAEDSPGRTVRTAKGKRAGRKPTNLKRDARVWDAWHSGRHADHAALARALGMTVREVKKSLDRQRKKQPKDGDG